MLLGNLNLTFRHYFSLKIPGVPLLRLETPHYSQLPLRFSQRRSVRLHIHLANSVHLPELIEEKKLIEKFKDFIEFSITSVQNIGIRHV